MREPAQDVRAVRLGVIAAIAWALVTFGRGGMDTGRPGGGNDTLVLALALVAGAVLAIAAVILRPTRWSTTARLGVAAMGAYVTWSACSILWAPAPDLAWLATDRAAVALAGLVVGFGIARALPRPLDAFTVAYALAALAVMAWSLLTRALPVPLAQPGETARLAAPLTSPNALALVAVMALPGGVAMARRGGRWSAPGYATVAIALTVVAATQSRSGFVALAVMLIALLWAAPGRAHALAAIATAVPALAPAIIYAYTASALQGEFNLPPAATRTGAGLVFGVLVVVGVAVTVLVAPSLVAPARRVVPRALRDRRVRVGLATLAGAVVIAGGVVVAQSDVAVRSGPARILNPDTNNRGEWWRQAWDATADAPIIGRGAGSFPLIHLQERREDAPRLQTREPHQLTLEVTSGLGAVGLLIALTGVGATLVAARRLGRPAVPAAAMLVAFLVQSQSDVGWSTPSAFLPAMAAAGTVLGAASAARPVGGRLPTRTLAIGVPLAVVATLSALALWEADRTAWNATGRLQAAEVASRTGSGAPDWEGVVQAAEAATGANPLGIRGLLVEARARDGQGRAGEAADAARRATERQPDNPKAWECLAAVTDGAEHDRALVELRRLDPVRSPQRELSCQPAW